MAFSLISVQMSHSTSPNTAKLRTGEAVPASGASLHFLYNFSQHSVSAERWSWAERLPALGAAVNTLLIILIPEFIQTGHTETVPT